MATYKSSFFYFMKYVYKAYKGITKYQDAEGNTIVYSEESQKTFDRLVDYVQCCEFSNKKVDKFLCRNWKASKEQLTELWEREFGKSKNKNTFRSQLSTLSHELYAIFGDEWPSDFMDDCSSDMRTKLDMLEQRAVNFNILTLSDTSLGVMYSSKGRYSIEDLSAELEFLHRYNREQYTKEFTQLDKDKMAYIKDRVDEPLCLNGKYNTEKAEILRRIEGIDFDTIRFPIEAVGSDKQLKVISKVVEVNEDKNSNAAKLGELKEFLYKAFTVEGLYTYLSQFSADDIRQVYKELNELARK